MLFEQRARRVVEVMLKTYDIPTADLFIVRRAGLLWSQQDFEWR